MNSELTKNTLDWWEKKRIWYNLIVLIFGVWQIIKEQPDTYNFEDIIGVVIYGLGANILYSIGILIELLDEYYFKTFFKFKRFRWFFLIIGTLFSILYTTWLIKIYYNGPVWTW
jgi:hypothetical protein